jgi:hypothetical protein
MLKLYLSQYSLCSWPAPANLTCLWSVVIFNLLIPCYATTVRQVLLATIPIFVLHPPVCPYGQSCHADNCCSTAANLTCLWSVVTFNLPITIHATTVRQAALVKPPIFAFHPPHIAPILSMVTHVIVGTVCISSYESTPAMQHNISMMDHSHSAAAAACKTAHLSLILANALFLDAARCGVA